LAHLILSQLCECWKLFWDLSKEKPKLWSNINLFLLSN